MTWIEKDWKEFKDYLINVASDPRGSFHMLHVQSFFALALYIAFVYDSPFIHLIYRYFRDLG